MIEIGKTYVTKGERGAYTCIAIKGKFAYLVSGEGATAYTWNVKNGKSLSLAAAWDLVLPKETQAPK